MKIFDNIKNSFKGKKKTDEELLLEKFYNVYFRSPKKEEFEACGGNIDYIERTYGGYLKFLAKFEYPTDSMNARTYEVIKYRTNEIIFTGTASDIAEEFNVCNHTVTRNARVGYILKEKYKIRAKPFRKEDVVG